MSPSRDIETQATTGGAAARADYAGTFSAASGDVLFVGDRNLGRERGWRVFSRFFPKARRLIWERGTPKAPLQREIRSRAWLFTVSSYSDFIFTAGDFPHLGLPLNLHPSLPLLRGVGHDVIPLIENHAEHGGTLHYMEPRPEPARNPAEGVDSGRIIRITKRPLNPAIGYAGLRALNQEIVLAMLAELCLQLSTWGCVATAHRAFCREADENGLHWGDRYIDQPTRARLTERLLRARGDRPPRERSRGPDNATRAAGRSSGPGRHGP